MHLRRRLGFDRRSAALLTISARVDWAGQSMQDLRYKAQRWAEAAQLAPGSVAAVGLWLAGVPAESPLVAHFGRLERQGISTEQQRLLLVAVLCDALLAGPKKRRPS